MQCPFANWTTVLPNEVKRWLYPPALWSIIESYRDNIWLCVAPLRFESKKRLLSFFKFARPYVQGAIICFSKRMSNVDNTTTTTDEKQMKHSHEAMNGTDIMEVCQAAGFSTNELLLIKHRKLTCTYSDLMNMAISQIKNRCRFFWELQTRDLLGESLVSPDMFYAALTTNASHRVMFRLFQQRTTIFRVDPQQPQFWICNGAAHSYITSSDQHYQDTVLALEFPQHFFPRFVSEGKHDDEVAYEIKLLEVEMNQTNATRACFYVANMCTQLKRYPEALQYFDRVIRHSNWLQEKYCCVKEMIVIDPESVIRYVRAAYAYDPRRFEVLAHALHFALIKSEIIPQLWPIIFNNYLLLANGDDLASMHCTTRWDPKSVPQAESLLLFAYANVGFQSCMMMLAQCASKTGHWNVAYAAYNTVCLPQYNRYYQTNPVPKETLRTAALRALLLLQNHLSTCDVFPSVSHLWALI